MGDMKPIRNIVILTGAGISAESGVDTFRDGGGLWEQHRVDTLCRVLAKKVEQVRRQLLPLSAAKRHFGTRQRCTNPLAREWRWT